MYRYGFNGKENDNEVKGAGNQQDYGMRIYDPRLGRFLSVDPITKSYPMLTPYQFASNEPISGIDLDGLEYLNSNTARIEVVRGIVKLKMSNMHNITRNTFENANNNPKYWKAGQIGINTQIAHIDWSSFIPNSVNNGFSEDPAHNQNKLYTLSYYRRIAYSTGQPDKRFNPIEIITNANATPLAQTRLGKTSAVLDVIITGESFLRSYLNSDDFNTAEKQVNNQLRMATYDVNQAIKAGKIPSNILKSSEKMSDVINYVLSGVSNLNDDEVISTGRAIYNEFSKQRLKYDGEFKIIGPGGQVIMNKPRPNPIYNPDYGKEDK